MSNMTFEEAQSACSVLYDAWSRANDLLARAQAEVDAAEAAVDDAGGFFDDSTAWDTSLAIGAGIVCFTLTAGWCAVAIVGGGAGVIASESDRQDEIDSAQARLRSAELARDLAQMQYTSTWQEWWSCITHHVSKGK